MKKLNNKGFTLAELLIVVAIIAVLVAISIPVFNSQLEKAREQTDVANIRAAKAIAVVAAMDNKIELNGSLKSLVGTDSYYFYDAAKGVFTTTKPSVGYGKGTGAKGGCQKVPLGTVSTGNSSYDENQDVRDKVLKCVFTTTKSTYKLSWVAAGSGS